MCPAVRPFLTKSDEKNIRIAFRHHKKMTAAFNRVKAPISEATESVCGQSYYASLHDGGTEDDLIDHIRECLEEYHVS
jgi:hypothetical protein